MQLPGAAREITTVSADGGPAIQLVRGDVERLRPLVDSSPAAEPWLRQALRSLEGELERAVVVDAAAVPPDVVTLDSWVRLLDLDSGQELLVSPVLPSKANADAGRISVLAPLGIAVLGQRTDDTIEWRVPSRVRRLRVLQVMFQPEAHARSHRALTASATRPRAAGTSRRAGNRRSAAEAGRSPFRA